LSGGKNLKKMEEDKVVEYIKDLIGEYLSDPSIVDQYRVVVRELQKKLQDEKNLVILKLQKAVIDELKEKFQQQIEVESVEVVEPDNSYMEEQQEAVDIEKKKKKKISFKKKILNFFSCCFCCK
jgi:hypothetical protein